MDKTGLRQRIRTAVMNTHARYDNFQGLVLFGSFLEKEAPADIDVVPVLTAYDDDWLFRSQSETGEEHSDAFYEYLEMENLFGSHFADFAEGYDRVFKTHRHRNGLFHDGGGVVALANLPYLKQRLDSLRASPENFIGTENAYTIMRDFYRAQMRKPAK